MGDDLTARLTTALEPHEDVTVAYLFGSAARGEVRPSSDVDVAILLSAALPGSFHARTPPPLTLASMRADIQADLQEAVRCPVDLVILNHASPDLIHRILRDGVLLMERDRSARIRFEVNARNEYFDVLPFLKRYREAALR